MTPEKARRLLVCWEIVLAALLIALTISCAYLANAVADAMSQGWGL